MEKFLAAAIALIAITGTANADSCATLTPLLNTSAYEANYHADQIGKLGAQLEAAGEANDAASIRLYASMSKTELYSAIGSVKAGLALLDRLENVGGCGVSRSQITYARKQGAESLTAFKAALKTVSQIAE